MSLRKGWFKRNLRIFGHKTSVSLEPPYWEMLDVIAKERNLTTSSLIGLIDSQVGGETNLASGIRCFVLAYAVERYKA